LHRECSSVISEKWYYIGRLLHKEKESIYV
jgi:hypothetical protein